MNRTQKKCFISAAGIHVLLLVILIVGPAFLASNDPLDDMPVIEFIPMMTTDKLFTGGGSPTANSQPAPQQPVPTPPPQVQQVVPPAPKPTPQPTRVEKVEQPTPVKPVKNDPEPTPTKVEPKRSLPKVSTTIVKRADVTPTKPTTPAKTPSQTQDNASKDFAKAAQRIRAGATSSTDIEMPGIGGGGPSYANYAQLVKSKYTLAWNPPDGIEDENANVKVSVTIARDGTVISARVTQSSGNAAVDRSVRSTLDRVTFIARFPEDSKDTQRTYIINFNLKAKLLLG